jgi:hypothetical protein
MAVGHHGDVRQIFDLRYQRLPGEFRVERFFKSVRELVQRFRHLFFRHCRFPFAWIAKKLSALRDGVFGGIHLTELVGVTADALHEFDGLRPRCFGLSLAHELLRQDSSIRQRQAKYQTH